MNNDARMKMFIFACGMAGFAIALMVYVIARDHGIFWALADGVIAGVNIAIAIVLHRRGIA